MTDPSLRFVDPTASAYSLQASLGAVVLAFWLAFSTVAAPVVIQKVLTYGALTGGPLIAGAFGSFFQTAATTAGAAAVASTAGIPMLTAGAAGMAAVLSTLQLPPDKAARAPSLLLAAGSRRAAPVGVPATTSPATKPSANSSPKAEATTTDRLWKPSNSIPRQTPTNNGSPGVRAPRKRFDPTQLFAQRDRLPWFWFFVAVAVTVGAAIDRLHLINQFKQRERVVIIDPAQTYYISPLLQFQEAKELHAQQAELAAMTFLSRNPKEFDHPESAPPGLSEARVGEGAGAPLARSR